MSGSEPPDDTEIIPPTCPVCGKPMLVSRGDPADAEAPRFRLKPGCDHVTVFLETPERTVVSVAYRAEDIGRLFDRPERYGLTNPSD